MSKIPCFKKSNGAKTTPQRARTSTYNAGYDPESHTSDRRSSSVVDSYTPRAKKPKSRSATTSSTAGITVTQKFPTSAKVTIIITSSLLVAVAVVVSCMWYACPSLLSSTSNTEDNGFRDFCDLFFDPEEIASNVSSNISTSFNS